MSHGRDHARGAATWLASSTQLDRTGSRGAARPLATDRGEPGVGALAQRDDALLYRGTRLAAWRAALGADRGSGAAGSPRPSNGGIVESQSLNDLEREFLDASDRRELRDRTARRRRMRFAFAGLAAALAAVTGVAILAVRQSDKAAHERDLAVSRQLAASATSQLVVDPEDSACSWHPRRCVTRIPLRRRTRSNAPWRGFSQLHQARRAHRSLAQCGVQPR